MKTALLAAALMLGTAAVAQDATTTDDMQDTTQPSGDTVDDPAQSTGPEGVTQQGTDPNGTATAPPVGTNQPPMTQAPMGTTQPPMTQAPMTQPGMMSNMPAPQAAMAEYPPCSRTVTDRCIQTYERGVRRPRR